MGLSLDLILIALVVLVLNVLDSVTTSLAFKQYPDRELEAEGNPFMRWLMLKSKAWAEVAKQLVVLGIISYLLLTNNLGQLRFVALLLGLVVLNNAFVIISRAITKRKVRTPAIRLLDFLHVPVKHSLLSYWIIIIVMCILVSAIYQLIWGW